MWSRSSGALGVFASLILHGAWLAGLRSEQVVSASAEPRAPAPYEIEIEAVLEPASEAPTWARAEIALGGPRSTSALDLDAADGRGGAEASDERSLLLFSFVSPITLQDSDLNNLRQNQTQRIATSTLRATQEVRRATPHPADAVFLASGQHGHKERRAPATHDAQAGAETRSREPRAEETSPARHDARSLGDSAALNRQPARRESQRTPRGIARGLGQTPQHAAKVELARPNVDRGPAATPAESQDAKVRDNHDAELLAAALQRSIVDASTQRAAQRADGIGGTSRGPGLSSEGKAQGARARPYFPGPGSESALNTEDARYVRWFVEQKERVQQELVFPTPRALAKDQGISIYRVVVLRDGRLAGAPHLVRSSGFSDFDDAAVSAIRRALPFSPLPDQLLPGEHDLSLLIPVAFSNPMVQ